MKLLISALFSISLLFTMPVMAEKPSAMSKGKEETKKMVKEVKDEVSDMAKEVKDEAEDIMDTPDNAAEEAIEEGDEMLEEALEKSEEMLEEGSEVTQEKMQGLKKNMDKGSDTGKQKREENIPWYDFWSE